ncbi:MAG: hypothetical protein HY927_15350 [Elusimicrobia bacterium]|nr:hypothetical protein [Elusimicrobiota bacterium]
MRRALGALAGCLTLAVVFEAAVRVALSAPGIFERVKGDDDASHRLEWVRGRGGREGVALRFDVHDARRGWALAPNVSGMPVFDGKVLNSNSKGIRGTEEYTRERPAGKLRIVALGDSLTFGDEVGDAETYPDRLRQSLPGTEVLNLGVHGYGHDQMLLAFRDHGAAYRPDIVLLGFSESDMDRNLLGFRDYAKPRFDLTAGGLILRNVPVPAPEAVLDGEPFRLRSLDLLTMLRHRWSVRSGAYFHERHRLTAAILDTLVDEVRAAGAVPVFVHLPYPGDFRVDRGSETVPVMQYDCGRKSVHCVSLYPLFHQRLRKGFRVTDGDHWDPAGNSVIAEGTKAYLVRQGLLKTASKTSPAKSNE